MAQHYIQLWERGVERGGLAILLRTAATNENAARRVRDVFRTQVLPAIAKVARNAPAVRAALIASQLLGMAYCRYVVKMPALMRLSEQSLAASLGRTIERYLDEPLGSTDSQT